MVTFLTMFGMTNSPQISPCEVNYVVILFAIAPFFCDSSHLLENKKIFAVQNSLGLHVFTDLINSQQTPAG
jgi:hypothetical protein